MKLVVFTPALNESKTLGAVLDKIPSKIEGITEIIKLVGDDGSTDNTAAVAKSHGAIVFSNYKQKRLAFTIQKGITKALELNADLFVNIDADGQFNPDQIIELLQPILKGEADVVSGNRFIDAQTGRLRKPKNMPYNKYLANRLGAKVLSILTGEKFPDVTCGFRALNREAMIYFNLSSNYTYTQESLQVFIMSKLNVVSIPIEVQYFKERKSRVVTNFFYFIISSALNILRAFRDYAPLRFFGILGALVFTFGLLFDIFITAHYINTQSFSPYIFVAFTGVYFNSMGIIIWIVGILADMQDRIRKNQEKILYYQKKNYYDSK